MLDIQDIQHILDLAGRLLPEPVPWAWRGPRALALGRGGKAGGGEPVGYFQKHGDRYTCGSLGV